MVRDKELHHESIISAATSEFLEYGFEGASMRRIAAAAGMSASGLYKHFASKEDMFSALVDPVYQGMMELYHSEENFQQEALSKGDMSNWGNSKDAELMFSYIYDHIDAFRLLVCKSQGTKYENFLHDFAVLEEKTTIYFMDILKAQGVHINDFSVKELHLLVTTNVNAVFQTVEHDFTREEAMHYAKTLDRFFAKAWQEFFGY